MKQPLIGITAYSYTKPSNGWLYDVCYRGNSQAIQRAGGLPVLIPAVLDDASLRAIYERMDAILLPGGGDVEPTRYTSDAPHPKVGSVDPLRDNAEILMAQWAADEDRPVFGICRGIQVMNVALGGTLIQDIGSTIPTDLTHNLSSSQPRATIMHEVQIKTGTRLADILGTTHIPVNSLHHQAVATPAPGTTVVANAPDGVIEALEVPDKAFMMAVQWHPEDMLDVDNRMQRLFDAFVQAARENMRD
jgi:putative glutamine amidotransferase